MLNAFGAARIGRDAELRDTQNGDVVCNVSLAFSVGRKGDDGRKPTTWVDGALWGKRAEALQQYLLKGQQVCVELRDVHTKMFANRDGAEQTKLVGTIAEIELVGRPPGERNERPAARSAPPAQRPAPQRPVPPRRPAAAGAGAGFDDMEDDIYD